MNKTDYIRSTQTGFVTTLVKAAVITLIVLAAIASLSSCERVADREQVFTNDWVGIVMKTGRKLNIKNTDSLGVLRGDTVTVFYMEGHEGEAGYYYIANVPEPACDTIVTEMYIDGKDTIYEKFEAWNVVLDRRIRK
jgi:hypothetical protein